MKVISGKFKGRNIKGYNIEGTRPTMDRVKESLFSIIQNYINDSVVLDLFAGSGNLGIEALSEGAKKCYFVDNNSIVIKTINENIKSFNIDNANIIKSDYKKALTYFKNKNIKFDLIFLDPPYKDNNYIDYSIKYILDNNLINNNGLIICEYENNINKDYNIDIYKEKKYGSKKIVIFKK